MTPFQHPAVLAPFRRPQPHVSPEPAPARADEAVAIRGLEKRYGRAEILRGVDMTLRRGRVTALIGPNASGKTTIIKSILGLVRPDAGRMSRHGSWPSPRPIVCLRCTSFAKRLGSAG